MTVAEVQVLKHADLSGEALLITDVARMQRTLQVIHLHNLQCPAHGQLENIVHNNQTDGGLVGQFQKVKAQEPGQERGGAIHNHVVVVGLEFPTQEFHLGRGHRFDDVLLVSGREEDHTALALSDLALKF